jgi:hypothetical protein
VLAGGEVLGGARYALWRNLELLGQGALAGAAGVVPHLAANLIQRVGDPVGSDRSAVPTFPSVRFSGPRSEPDVRVTTHPALHKFMPFGSC